MPRAPPLLQPPRRLRDPALALVLPPGAAATHAIAEAEAEAAARRETAAVVAVAAAAKCPMHVSCEGMFPLLSAELDIIYADDVI
jgi:hypothetical protein